MNGRPQCTGPNDIIRNKGNVFLYISNIELNKSNQISKLCFSFNFIGGVKTIFLENPDFRELMTFGKF